MSLGLLVLALWVGQSEADREAELFGAAPTETGTVVAPLDQGRDEAAMFGGETSTTTTELERDAASLDGKSSMGRLSDAVQANDDFLDLGGELWLFGQAAFAREGDLQDTAVSSPSFMDLYLDVRPTDRLRAYARGRLSYDFTVASGAVDFLGRPQPETNAALDQLWLKFDLFQTVFVTAGKQRIRWGSSRIWNPTDFLNLTFRDPFNFLDLRLGVPLLKLHLPVEALGWNFYAIAALEDASSLKGVGGALRAELTYETAELALSAVAKKDAPIFLGVDLSAGVWLIDFRAELALTHRSQQPKFVGRFDVLPQRLDDGSFTGQYEAFFPTRTSRYDDWVPQLVLGFDLNIPVFENDTLIVGAEYLYNQFGYSDANLLPILLLTQNFNPLYASQQYLGLSAVAIGPGDFNNTTIVAFAATSLSDQSWFARLQYSVRVLTYLDLGLFGSLSFGKDGAFNVAINVPGPIDPSGVQDSLAQLGVDVSGAGAAAGLGQLNFAAPRLILGATLNLRL